MNYVDTWKISRKKNAIKILKKRNDCVFNLEASSFQTFKGLVDLTLANKSTIKRLKSQWL